MFLLGINILQYFAHSVVSAPLLLLFNADAEAALFGGEIWMLAVWEEKRFRSLELFQNKMFSEASRAPLSPSFQLFGMYFSQVQAANKRGVFLSVACSIFNWK